MLMESNGGFTCELTLRVAVKSDLFCTVTEKLTVAGAEPGDRTGAVNVVLAELGLAIFAAGPLVWLQA